MILHPKLSIIIPTKNDHENFKETLISINKNCNLDCQIVIVDGGDEFITHKYLHEHLEIKPDNLKYVRDKGCGVFPAQNLGIICSVGEWLMVLNSGDLLNSVAKKILTTNYLNQFDNKDIIVFSQETYSEHNEKYKFLPTDVSVWPHQSILAKKSVYDNFGLYREDISTCSEQLYFAQIRNKINYIIIDLPLTSYKLGGLSSKINFKISRDIYITSIALGQNKIVSFFKSFISPYVRKLCEKTLGYGMANKLKILLYRYYKEI